MTGTLGPLQNIIVTSILIQLRNYYVAISPIPAKRTWASLAENQACFCHLHPMVPERWLCGHPSQPTQRNIQVGVAMNIQADTPACRLSEPPKFTHLTPSTSPSRQCRLGIDLPT